MSDSVLEIIAQGAWNGGTLVDNSVYENQGMFFKGGIPVNPKTIEERVGVRNRVSAGLEERIGVVALKDLLAISGIDPSRIRVIVAATNIGEDKNDPGPFSRHAFDQVRSSCPRALVLDLYAGCPGFNVSVELLWMLSRAGVLRPGDLSIIVGAENIHRANVFYPLDTSNIIFGDDALATALETHEFGAPLQAAAAIDERRFAVRGDAVLEVAHHLAEMAAQGRIDGILVDNQMGALEYRVPALAARIQHAMVERLYPLETTEGLFRNFKTALEFYDGRINSFAFDVMSLEKDPAVVKGLAAAYAGSERYRRVAAIYLSPGRPVEVTILEGENGVQPRPTRGVIDAATRTHGCFAAYIEALRQNGEVYGFIDGKGVFLHATRGASHHLGDLLSRHGLTLRDMDLLVEHQANFAMIPLTLMQILGNGHPGDKAEVASFIAEKMLTNVHLRGNCSVVCMQRLPYEMMRGGLAPDTVQGFAVNRNVEGLKNAALVLYDSVGAGMTRSSFLMRH